MLALWVCSMGWNLSYGRRDWWGFPVLLLTSGRQRILHRMLCLSLVRRQADEPFQNNQSGMTFKYNYFLFCDSYFTLCFAPALITKSATPHSRSSCVVVSEKGWKHASTTWTEPGVPYGEFPLCLWGAACVRVCVITHRLACCSLHEPMALTMISSLLIEGVFTCPCGGLGQGGVINTWPVEPFETVLVNKGYTNKIELKLNWLIYPCCSIQIGNIKNVFTDY